MTRIAGSHVVVTGGSLGIGLAAAQACAERGARVSIIGRDRERLAAAQRQLGEVAAVASADVTDPEALDTAFADVAEIHGSCDILVAAAGQAEPGYFLDLGTDVFRRQMELNYFGTLHAVRAALPSMVEQARGHVVLLSSVSGLIGIFGYGAYTPTKFAVRGLGEALDSELRPRGIVTTIVYPPDTDTPGFHRENLTKPPETARLSAGIPPVSADRVARAIVRGIERDRLHVAAEWQTRIIARIADLHGPPVRAAMRWRLRG
ncbi:SDR family oxidoreductase [soil metagenome]